MPDVFTLTPALGLEVLTDEYYVDSSGATWPIYQKTVDFGAGPNATFKDVAHNIVNLKADGHFKISHAQFVKAATAPVVMDGAALVGSFPTLTQVRLAATANLTTFTGRATIEYNKTS